MSNVPGHSLAKVCERSTAAASLIAGTDLGLFPHAPPPPPSPAPLHPPFMLTPSCL